MGHPALCAESLRGDRFVVNSADVCGVVRGRFGRSGLIYTYHLPCGRLGAREIARRDAQNQRGRLRCFQLDSTGNGPDYEGAGLREKSRLRAAREVKVGSQA
jgi:hypothetical protein